MNKIDLIKHITEASTEVVNQKQVAAMLVAMESVVKNAIRCDDDVTIPGICKVKSKIVPERSGKVMLGANKGDTWTKPEHKEATLKIAKSLKTIFE